MVQTFTGDLRRYVHVHALVSDGVWERVGDGVEFLPAPVPSQGQIRAVAEELAALLTRPPLDAR